MFVEITRLLIVLLSTAAGFALGRGDLNEPGNGAVIGATLGACLGYVLGGAVGRLLRRAMHSVEQEVERAPAAQLLVGTLGGAATGVIAALIGAPAVALIPQPWGWPVAGLFVWMGVYSGFTIASRKSEELLALLGLSTRPLVRASRYGNDDGGALLLDTSAVMDLRLLEVAKAGFLRSELLVPRFVIDELQSYADAQDETRRRRGRRGLETLDALRREPGMSLHVLDDEVPEFFEVDAKLVAVARRLGVNLVTVDSPLQHAAEIQGVRCMNLNRLATSVRQQHIQGEVVRVPVTAKGRDAGQGVGYLDDGTMVVIKDGEPLIGSDVEVRITGASQTAVGRMLFASVNE